jgi:hypothetical protein
MSKFLKTKMKVFATEKDVAAFFQSGEVGSLIGLHLRKNESFVMFYLPYEKPETEENTDNKKIKKGPTK